MVNAGGSIDRAVSHTAPVQNEILAQQAQQAPAAQASQAAQNVSTSQNIGGGNMSNKFISGDNGTGGIDDFTNNLMNTLMEYLKPFLEPVQVSYSNEVLANQIYGLSIALFVLSLMIIVLLIFFIINIIVFTYSDKIMNYFSNKYIR